MEPTGGFFLEEEWTCRWKGAGTTFAEAGRGEYLPGIYYGEIHLFWGYIELGEVAPLGDFSRV